MITRLLRKLSIRHLMLSVGLVSVSIYSIIFIFIPFGKDAGAFIVIGEGILSGQLPYVNLWDHKPPGVYIATAIGILLFKSVFLLKIIIISLTLIGGVLIYKLVEDAYTVNAAYLAGFSYVFAGLIYAPGQFPTETFAALALVGVLFCTKDGISTIQDYLAVGLLLGIGGLFKQPVGLVFIGIVVYEIYKIKSISKKKM